MKVRHRAQEVDAHPGHAPPLCWHWAGAEGRGEWASSNRAGSQDRQQRLQDDDKCCQPGKCRNTEPALKPVRVREGFPGGDFSELLRLKGGNNWPGRKNKSVSSPRRRALGKAAGT